MRKPLHKDPLFWIVAVVALGAVNLAQFYLAVPWFAKRMAAVEPPPKPTNLPNQIFEAGGLTARQPVNLDTNKKTFVWQTPRPQPRLLDDTPPQVIIIPTEYQPPSGGWSMPRGDKAIGIRMPPQSIIQAAYRWTSWSRMVWPDHARGTPFGNTPATGYYDFIANLPTGALEALQEEAKKKLGLVAERQTFQTNVLTVKVHHSDAPGLKPATTPTAFQPNQTGGINFRTVPSLVSFLESVLRRPVLDQTGLTGTFDIQLPSTAIRPPGRVQTADSLEPIKKVLLEQLGLELVETNAPVEFLVVRKVN